MGWRMEFRIESMKAEDWPQVRAIYDEGVATGQATSEKELPSWEQWDQTLRASWDAHLRTN